MPTYYNATSKFTVVYEVICENCNAPFSYRQEFISLSGTFHSSREGARDAADKSNRELYKDISKAFQERNFNAAKDFACPQCGYYQQWMVNSVKERVYGGDLISSIVIAGISAIFLIMLPFGWKELSFQFGTVLVPFGIALLSLIGLLFGIRGYVKLNKKKNDYNPNMGKLDGRPTPIMKLPKVKYIVPKDWITRQ